MDRAPGVRTTASLRERPALPFDLNGTLVNRRAGTATVAVLWGYRSREQLVASVPDHPAATVEELGELLDGASGARRP